MKKLPDDQCKVLVGFKRQGGNDNLNDVRKLAGLERGTPLANRLLKANLLRKYQQDEYALTPEGHAAANDLLDRGENKLAP
jgi:hypothetical protein